MKKIVSFVILNLFISFVFAQNFDINGIQCFPYQNEMLIWYDDQILLRYPFLEEEPFVLDWREFDENDSFFKVSESIEDTGYVRLDGQFDRLFVKNEKGYSVDSGNRRPFYYLLEGQGIIFLQYPGCEYFQYDPFTKKRIGLEEWIGEKQDRLLRSVSDWQKEPFGCLDDGIEKIESSSSLREKVNNQEITYKAENVIGKLYAVKSLQEGFYMCYDSIIPPWVEGVPGYGIGEWLDVTFKYESDQIQILNGYVDFEHKDYYKKNSRVKTVLIESESPAFSQEFELADLVQYTVLNLPAKTNHIKIIIKDVYPGTRYDDTCISSILVTNPSLPSYEEEKNRIEKILVKNGMMDVINRMKAELPQ